MSTSTFLIGRKDSQESDHRTRKAGYYHKKAAKTPHGCGEYRANQLTGPPPNPFDRRALKNPAASLLAVFLSWRAADQARAILALIGALLLSYLLLGDKPWGVEVMPGRLLKISQYIAIYFWFAALGNLLLVGILAATASWWTHSMPAASPEPTPGTSPVFRLLVIGAMIAAAVMAWPRMGQSFWHDESERVEDVLVGKYQEDEKGQWQFHSLPWRDTVFQYRVPNHVLQSILSRAANEVWRFAVRPTGLQFSETAIRLPGFLAGIGAVAALAFLLARLGFPAAGALAAWVLALHPWFLRYATEARAYNYVLLFVPVYFLIVRALWKEGRVRAWVAFGAVEFLLMFVYPAMAFVLAVTNLVLLPVLFVRWRWTPAFFTQTGRWFIANLAAAMLFLQMMLPCIPQFLDYVAKTPGQGDLGMRWLKNVGGFFLAGLPWSYSFQPVSPFLELWPWAEAHPFLMSLIICAAVLLLALGFLRLVTKSVPSGLFAVVLPLAAAVCVLESKRRGGYLFEWYVIFLLPGLVAFLAVGVREICRLLPVAGGRDIAFAALSFFLLSTYVAWTAPQREFLRGHSLQPYRESVALTRPTLDPRDPAQDEILTTTFYSKPFPYDPRIILFANGPELGALVRRADAENKSLFVNLGFLVTVRGEHPNKYRFLKESGFFDDLGILPGFMETLGRHVFRYRPGRAADYDFSTLPADIGRSDKDQKTPAVDIGGGNLDSLR